jgi:hypothetical protein
MAVMAHVEIMATAPGRPGVDFHIKDTRASHDLRLFWYDVCEKGTGLRGKKLQALRGQLFFLTRIEAKLLSGNEASRRKSQLATLDTLEEGLARVKDRVPEELRRVTRLPRAEQYDDRGTPLSTAAIAQSRVLERFVKAMAEGPDSPFPPPALS